MRRVFLSAGHTNVNGKDQGAYGNGFIEGKEAVEFASLLNANLSELDVIVFTDPPSNTLADTIRSFARLIRPLDVAIDIHFNASANPEATGTEVIIPGIPNMMKASDFEFSLAFALANDMAITMNIKNRGRKTESQTPRAKLGWMRLPCENILLEICFISNKSDMKKYQETKYELAKVLAKTIAFHCKH